MRRLARGVCAAWEAFWFAPVRALDVTAARRVLAGQALWILLSRDIPALSGLPAEFWSDLDAAARWRFLIWEGRPGLESLVQGATCAALAGVVLGVAPRLCCALAGLLLYHLAPLETLFFTPSPWAKGLTLPVLGLLTLSATRCGDPLSVLPGRRGAPYAEVDGWGLRLVQLFVCQQYLFSGYAKLASAGWSWAGSENIRSWLLLANLDDQLVVFRTPGLWIADRPALCLLTGVAALALDLGFVATLFSRRVRRWLVPGALLFHLAILVTLNYAFLGAPLLLLFVDWGSIRRTQ